MEFTYRISYYFVGLKVPEIHRTSHHTIAHEHSAEDSLDPSVVKIVVYNQLNGEVITYRNGNVE